MKTINETLQEIIDKARELQQRLTAITDQGGLFHQIWAPSYPVSPEVEQDVCTNSNQDRYLELQRAVEEADRINEEYFIPLKKAFEAGNMSETQRLYNRIADEKPSCYLVTVIEPAKKEVVEFGNFDL